MTKFFILAVSILVTSCETDLSKKLKEKDRIRKEISDKKEKERSEKKDIEKKIRLLKKKQDDSISVVREKEAPKKLKSFVCENDEFKNTKYYFPKGSPRGYTSEVVPYIGEKGGLRWLRVKFQYMGDNWLFVENIQFKISNTVIDYVPPKMEKDNSGGSVHEYIDVDGSDEKVKNILWWISNSDAVKVRYNGKQYFHERRMSKSEIQRIKEAYDVFY